MGKMNDILIEQLNELEISEQEWYAVLFDFLKEDLKEPDHVGPKQWYKLTDLLPEIRNKMLYDLPDETLYWYELNDIRVEDIYDCLMKLGYKMRKTGENR